MPPRTKYTPEVILDSALDLVRQEGMGALTARNLAKQMGCSTGPVFRHFSSMEEVLERVMERITRLFVGALGSVELSDPLVSWGVGWLRFAAQEPRLYEAAFLRPHPWHDKWGAVRLDLAARMAEVSGYEHLSRGDRFALIGRASIVMHGLGLEIWSGRLAGDNLEGLIRDLVMPVVEAALALERVEDLHSRGRTRT